MKHLHTLLITLLSIHLLHAQGVSPKADTSKASQKKVYTSIEKIPEFPGGITAFYTYLSKNLHYPDVARLLGINGKLVVSFVVDKDGRVTDVTPKNCVGAGCEAEAVRLLESSPAWKPGIQDDKPVRVMYSVPISFTVDKGEIKMNDLRASNYGFIFNIKGKLYLIDEAEALLGKSFMSEQIDISQPFYNYNKIQKFEIPDKKEVYLIIIKPNKPS
jgi:protein TonB